MRPGPSQSLAIAAVLTLYPMHTTPEPRHRLTCTPRRRNFPIGDKTPLDTSDDPHAKHGWELRWEVPLHLFDGLFCQRKQTLPPHLAKNKDAMVALQALAKVVQAGQANDQLARQPHMVLLDEQFYQQHMRPVLAQWMLLFLRPRASGTRAGVPWVDCASYLQGGYTPDEGRALEAKLAQAKLSKHDRKLLKLTRQWLEALLPFCLKKINRVSFGLMNEAELSQNIAAQAAGKRASPLSRTQLAIPFVGKDVPSAAAEFAQPDIVSY